MKGTMKKMENIRSLRKNLVLAVAMAALAACSAGSGDPIKDATVAIEKQDYRAARIHLLSALKANAADPQANYLFAQTLLELGDGVGAEASLNKLASNPEYKERVQPMLGRAYLLQGKFDKALATSENPSGKYANQLYAVKALTLIASEREPDAEVVLAEALTKFPDDAELHWVRGNLDFSRGALDAAIKNTNIALKKEPNNSRALLLAGRISLAKADGKKALAYFTKVNEIRPDNIDAAFLRGAVLKDLGEEDKAREALQAVLSERPNHPFATYLLAEMDYLDGKSTEAFDRLQAAKVDIEAIPQALRLSGILESQRGNFEQAIQKLKRYLAQNDPDAPAIVALARAYSGAGNDQLAFESIVPLARSVTAPAETLKLAASLATKVNNPAAASLQQRAAQLEKDPVLNQLFDAEHAIIGKQWAEAEKIYSKLKGKDALQQTMLLNNSALVQLSLGKGVKAIELAKEANKLTPNNPIVMDTLGWAMLVTQADRATALELLKRAAAAAPDNGEIHWHLANAYADNGKTEEAKQLIARLAVNGNDKDKAKLAGLLQRL